MRRKRKIIAYLLSMSLMLTSLPIQLFAQEVTTASVPMTTLVDTQTTTPGAIQINPTKYVGDGYEVEFKVTNQWPGAFNGEFVLTNTSDKPLENWTLKFNFEHEITNMWNAQIVTHEANSYIIKNMGHNQDIAPSSSVNIGFQADWNDEIKVPESYDLLIAKQEVGDTDYTIDFKVTGDWGQSFNGEISITNNTEEAIEDWTLEFDFDRNIERFWTAEIVEHEGEHYIIKNAGYNANIAPGQTITLGFSGNPGNVDSKPTNYVLNQLGQEIDYTKDTDGDGLLDYIEKEIGTSINNVDTDGDLLSDYYEFMILFSSPLVQDTNEDTISDAEEDIDSDGLSNFDEMLLKTNPRSDDTDGDSLKDGDEINTYQTNPLLKDTDDDGLEDGDEIILGFNPVIPDTNGNGVLDGQEKVFQTYEQNIDEPQSPQITKVEVSFAGTGNIKNSTSITNINEIDKQTSEVEGIFGIPVDISTCSKFDSATITFTYDPDQLGDVLEEDLAIMWYDEENNWYKILDDESIIDTNKHTVSVQTNHFSKYLVVDRRTWYAAWSKTLDYRKVQTGPDDKLVYYDIAFVVDKSGSMGTNYMQTAIEAIHGFISAMLDNDRGCIITFDTSATLIQGLTTDKYALGNAARSIISDGGTDTNVGLDLAITTLENSHSFNQKLIIMLCDGDVNYVQSTVNRAKVNGYKVYTINLGSTGGENRLKEISRQTGGEYYYVKKMSELLEIFYELKDNTINEIDDTDTDGDGLADVFEIVGMRNVNGKIYTSDPLLPDTDFDGVSDFKEMGPLIQKPPFFEGITKYERFFIAKSHPRNPDFDEDGIKDDVDQRPWNKDTLETMFKLSSKNKSTNSVYIKIDDNNVDIYVRMFINNWADEKYRNFVIDGIESEWNTSFNGNKYDFMEGIKGNVRIHIEEIEPLPGNLLYAQATQQFELIYIYDIPGQPMNPTALGWYVGKTGRILLYTDFLGYGKISDDFFPKIAAHELGHSLGLWDAYPEANIPAETLNANEEIKIDSIMWENGPVTSNDIEMVLEAFSKNKQQHYYDSFPDQKSEVVRCPQTFKPKEDWIHKMFNFFK